MRIALLVAASVLAAREAHADCGCHAQLLTTKVAEGSATLVYEASCARKPPTIALRTAGGATIATKRVTTHTGVDNWNQFVFEAEKPLVPGTYTVVVDGVTSKPPVLEVVKAGQGDLRWPDTPKVTDQHHMELGCGPVEKIRVHVGVQAPLAYVELVDVASKTMQSGYVAIDKGELVIGHGMCGGMFRPVKGREYTASIKLWSPAAPTMSSVKALSVRYTPK